MIVGFAFGVLVGFLVAMLGLFVATERRRGRLDITDATRRGRS